MRFFRWSVLVLLALLAASPIALAQDRQDRPGRPERAAQAKPADEAQRTAPACCGCCRRTRSATRRSRSAAARSPTPRPPARSRCSTRTAKRPPPCSTPPMSPRTRDAARRPLTFVFNGGPGAASVYLNLGLAGPRIVDFGPDGRDGAAAKLVDNPDYLARLHRSGDDRSDRHRLEPHGQARRRQERSGACAATPTCSPR